MLLIPLFSLLLACAAHADDPHVEPRIFLDPGHGAEGNPGNTNSGCDSEEDVMLALAQVVKERLVERGAEVLLSREPGRLVSYDDRLSAAADWKADVFVSLHSDVRAVAEQECPSLDGREGFSILWGSDAEDSELPKARKRLAQRLGQRMTSAGFVPFRGDTYGGIYAEDAQVPGVFLDTHKPHQRIKVLRRASMPSVIVETHHAWVADEVALWEQPVVILAFADALYQGVSDHLRP